MITLDLLLDLDSNLADVLTALINYKVTQDEKQQTLTLIEQYNRLKETHSQIHCLLEQYNNAIQRMMMRGGVEEIYPFCTYSAYQAVDKLYNAMMQYQVSHHQLEELELLSINLVEQAIEETRFNYSECPVDLNADALVSRQHARLDCHNGQWFISDLNSRTGIRVNGQPVRQQGVQHGDEIQMGNTRLRFYLQ